MPARLLCLALVTLPALGFSQEVRLPAEISAVPGAWVIVAPEIVSGGKPKFRIDPGLQEVRLDILFPPEVANQARGKVLTATAPGKYRVECWNAKGDVPSEIASCWVTILGPAPGPTPTPPGPTPDPVPPQPPTPPPTPVAGPIRALVIYETADIGRLKWEQVGIINSNAVRSYFTTKGYRGPDSTLALRFWDDDYPQASIPADWWATYDAARTEAAGRFPWLIIETKDGKRAYSGPVGSEAEALSKLKQWGGE